MQPQHVTHSSTAMRIICGDFFCQIKNPKIYHLLEKSSLLDSNFLLNHEYFQWKPICLKIEISSVEKSWWKGSSAPCSLLPRGNIPVGLHPELVPGNSLSQHKVQWEVQSNGGINLALQKYPIMMFSLVPVK